MAGSFVKTCEVLDVPPPKPYKEPEMEAALPKYLFMHGVKNDTAFNCSQLGFCHVNL